MTNRLIFLFIFLIVCAPAYVLVAEDVKGKESIEEEFDDLRPGVVSSQGNYGFAGGTMAGGGGGAPGDENPPVVARIDGKACQMSVTNRSVKKYSLKYEIQFTKNGRVVRRTHKSITVPGLGSKKSSVSGCRKDYNVRLLLKSGRALE